MNYVLLNKRKIKVSWNRDAAFFTDTCENNFVFSNFSDFSEKKKLYKKVICKESHGIFSFRCIIF